MSRPIKENVDYIPMFCNPCRTLQILEQKYGNDGYSFFYKLLQILGNEQGHYYDCRNIIDLEFLAGKMGFSSRKLQKMLENLSEWGKIDKFLWENSIIWYESFVETLKPVYDARTTKLPTKDDCQRKTGVFSEKTIVTKGKPGFSGITRTDNPQSKVKESKVKESKENTTTTTENDFLKLKDKRSSLSSLEIINNFLNEKDAKKNIIQFLTDNEELIETISAYYTNFEQQHNKSKGVTFRYQRYLNSVRNGLKGVIKGNKDYDTDTIVDHVKIYTDKIIESERLISSLVV